MAVVTRRIDQVFEVRAVDGFDDGTWWWEIFADGTFLDGGGFASDSYASADEALDMAEALVRDSVDFRSLAAGAVSWGPPAHRRTSTDKMADPRSIIVSAWSRTDPAGEPPDYLPFTSLVVVNDACVTFYRVLSAQSFKAQTVCLDDPPMWDQLAPLLALAKLRSHGADDEFHVDAREFHAVRDQILGRAPVPAGTGDLEEINAHRRRIGMRPLDPAAAGWTDEDVRLEAQRIRALNPAQRLREAALAW